jgi:hypothetical protein
MKTLLWLDDIRNPFVPTKGGGSWLVFSPINLNDGAEVVWVKSYQEFVDWITANGLPDGICFDHDLGLDLVHEKKVMSKRELKRFRKTPEYKTGFDCTKWLVEYCLDRKLYPPKYNIQSSNTVGKANIDGLLKNFMEKVSYD